MIVDTSAPPVRFSPTPAGELQPGTTQATLGLFTNKAATCKYSLTPGVAYASMPNIFQTTGGPDHSTLVSGLEDGQTYEFYVRCNATTPNLDDLLISFSIRALDTTPPMATNLQTSWASNALFVSWDTDDSSTVSVAYGLSPTSLDQSVTDGVLVKGGEIMYHLGGRALRCGV